MQSRITFHLKCPNPLLESWIEEIYLKAFNNDSRSQHTLKIALRSIRQYPLVLKSGSECAILKGFGKKLCNILDKKLRNYRKSSIVSKNSDTINSDFNINNKNRSSPLCIGTKSPNKKSKDFIPTYRSGGFAILLTLLKNHQTNEGFMSKTDIQSQAQVLCDESMIKGKPGSFYTAWSSMTALVSKGYVTKKRGRNIQYSLSNEGYSLAQELSKQVEEFAKSLPKESREDQFTSLINPLEMLVDKSPIEIEPGYANLTLENKDDLWKQEKPSIEFVSKSFDVILLVDKQETSGKSKKEDATILELNKYKMIKYELRHLKVGDFTWIARHKNSGKELILPHIVERKRMDDLAGSIKDGRFHEQKFRLKQCGIPNIIYLIESHGNNQHTGLPLSTLIQAVTNTRVQDGFTTHFTLALSNSIKFLAMMTNILSEYYKEKTLIRTLREKISNSYNQNDSIYYLMEFDNFNALASKSKALTVKDLFIKQLLQLKGVSVEKAIAITSIHKTPHNLMVACKNCDKNIKPELILAEIKYGAFNGKIGPTLSKTIYHYFSKDALS